MSSRTGHLKLGGGGEEGGRNDRVGANYYRLQGCATVRRWGVERTKMQPYFAIEIYTTVLQGAPRS